MIQAFEEKIEICICTFRRSALIDALRSLEGTDAEVPVSILVIDNDDSDTARPIVEDFAATSALPVAYVHCPGANISIARNAALTYARARFLAFLDDDETAGPNWLTALAQAMKDSAAAVVLGPVTAVYGNDAPPWMRRADLHSTAPVVVKGEITTGYSCNVLIDRAHPAFEDLRFRIDLGRSGGEDTAFFAEAHARGAKIAFAPNAVVYEVVPPDRARFGWLAKRRFRMGQTHGRLVLQKSRPVQSATLALAKTAYCAGAALLSVFSPVRRNRAILRGCLHAGALSAHLGLRPLQLYGQNNKGVLP